MGLSDDLISQFVKITNDDKKKNETTTSYGTVVEYAGNMYVKLDGSDMLTPVDTTTEISNDDRVVINIGGHNAVVSGNLTNPSVSRIAIDGFESKIERTAESLTSTITNTKEGLESRIQQTSKSLTASIQNTKSDLETKIQFTSNSLTSSIKSTKEGLESLIQQTSKDLTLKFQNGYEQGITTINKDGIKVTHSGYGGYTHMASTGFWIHNGTENIMSATSSGLYVKGSVTITSGSININNNFIVNSSGSLTTNSTIMAQGGLYTYQDIRGMDSTPVTGGLTLVTGVGNISLRCESSDHSVYLQPASGRAYVTFPNVSDMADLSLRNLYAVNLLELSGSTAVVRATHDGHLYLQCGSSNAELTSSEVRCTRSAAPNDYINLRAYNVCAENAVFAQGVNVSSDRNKKRDIELYNVDAIKEICSTPVYTYHLDGDLDDELKRIGLIMQEAPLDAIDLNGKGIDLYQMASMIWRAIQQQQSMIDGIQKTLKGEE